MIEKFKDFFNFNTTERNGIIILLLLILITSFVPRLFKYYKVPDDNQDYSGFRKDILEFEKSLVHDSVNQRLFGDRENSAPDKKNAKVKLFPFDPNQISDDEWLKLGLKEWQIRILDNYRKKGGRFKEKADLKNIYGISEEQYKVLEPFITLPENSQGSSPCDNKDKKVSFYERTRVGFSSLKIDINTADTTDLDQLKGIGPSFARRIIRYRELLGGFYSVSQLLEVYGFDQQKLEGIINDCYVKSGPQRLLNINTASLQELKKHPYFDYAIAKSIIDRRIIRGKFKSIDELQELEQIPIETFEKLRHYVSVDDKK